MCEGIAEVRVMETFWRLHSLLGTDHQLEKAFFVVVVKMASLGNSSDSLMFLLLNVFSGLFRKWSNNKQEIGVIWKSQYIIFLFVCFTFW